LQRGESKVFFLDIQPSGVANDFALRMDDEPVDPLENSFGNKALLSNGRFGCTHMS
jgi:hypothetical protein